MPDSADAGLSARLTIPGNPLAVRSGLTALLETRLLRSLPETCRNDAELVLAEALNNIVEHAYANQPGHIEISLQRQARDLFCRISDSGLPMPDGCVTSVEIGAAPAPQDPPEGGFGWLLIRSLSQGLHYHRIDGRNLLSFRLPAVDFCPAPA